ncbi:hypothetical protein [Bradyrhizobium lablabi]|uniref:hypothetical protein n=1 Tax=Bradyrhizobium lablabi TaxID=722472 RepID=UPI001BA9BC90|nr:hypothetical protein [Bradyrhizobium lablabi]MBR0696686.1 hypothetical protein [Bradyrhizobium lablabi]
MSRTSFLKHSIRIAAAAFLFAGLLSPAHAANQQDAASVYPVLPVSASAHDSVNETGSTVAHNRALKLTSRRPWLAPVGHRQPRRAEISQSETLSTWEEQQKQLDAQLDRKLVICRGC